MYQPKFERIADDIRHQIKTGILKEGDKIPTYHQLAAEYETGASVVRSALLILKLQGVVEGRQGEGVFVAGGAR